MALAEPAQLQERRASPNLSLELPSNNPFRNRAVSPSSASPAIPSPQSVQSAPGNRPVSRNPFLAAFEEDKSPPEDSGAKTSALDDMSAGQKQSPQKTSFGASTQELFDNLKLDDKMEKDKDKERPRKGPNGRPMPPMRAGSGPNQFHRPTRSTEDERRANSGSRRPPRPRGPPSELNIFDSPEKGEGRHRRRNSESSIADKGPVTEEDKKRRERRREREKRDKDGKSRSGRPPRTRGLDVIDKLDVTGIYGSGLFHHDGPFDACNPHRNRKKDHRAPMQAFPANSANNAIGGSGPINKNIDLERFHGRGAEGFTDFNTSTDQYDYKRRTSNERPQAFNPIERVEQVHGEESIGLGTSTFLEGSQASRTAIQRRQSENETAVLPGGGGIQRKKSLAQRLRGMSQPRPRFAEDGTGPRIGATRGPLSPETPLSAGSPKVQSAGPTSSERNPFFEDYDEAYDKKGASIKFAEGTAPPDKPSTPTSGRPPLPASPLRGGKGESAIADDAVTSPSNEAPPKSGGGFLSRVKSLKGGKRARPERPER